ncbi:hypothetical protein ACFVJ5_07110 [Nocardia sp. NPDC127606]|uniref:hypothetical protein n=1 Tax=Nocardia sp. NPDC127606 TaxID=3345406 RepID=UPI00363369FA
MVALTALVYAPLAFEYGWHYFEPGSPRPRESLIGALVSRDFAFGPGSVADYRAADHAQLWAPSSHETTVMVTLGLLVTIVLIAVSAPVITEPYGVPTLLVMSRVAAMMLDLRRCCGTCHEPR